MRRSDRLLSMISATLALGGLGLLVAVAAKSRPGDLDEPWLDVAFQTDVDLGPALAWIVVIGGVIWAVLAALGLKSRAAERTARRRNVIGMLLGLVAVVAVVRWLRPDADITLLEPGQVAEPAGEAVESPDSRWPGWTLFVLLGAVLAASLTRIGLAIGSVPDQIEIAEETSPGEFALSPRKADPRPRALGDDPASQILNAYGSFEDAVAKEGAPRLATETESRHARRARRMLGLRRAEVDALVALHADTRYGDSDPSQEEADRARDIADGLRSEMG